MRRKYLPEALGIHTGFEACSYFAYNPTRRCEVWRFLTYMFIHAGNWHIGGNVFMQLLVGKYIKITDLSARVPRTIARVDFHLILAENSLALIASAEIRFESKQTKSFG